MGLTRASKALGLLLAVLYVFSGAAQGSSAGFQLAGLALHQETGRNIYLGGIYFAEGLTSPYDYTSDSEPRIMEYRVVARRTSIRSMLGGMLLQSEVATGQPPNPATAAFANDIISAVDGSLYAGDTLQIVLNAEGGTIAYLNGHEMARGKDPAVALYLMMGWVGEPGPTTAFRDSILADDIDPALLSTLQATTYSAERDAQIAAWTAPTVQEPVTAVESIDEPAAQQQATAAAAAGTALTSPPTLEQIETKAQTVLQLPAPEETEVVVADPGLSGNPGASIQVASLLPTTPAMADTGNEVDSMDITLYSQRLSAFHTQLVSKVYGQIRYPRRAVRRELQGRLELDLTLKENGELVQVAVVQSSGHSILDQAAVAAAEKAFKDGAMDYVDPVAIAEFSNMDSGNLVIPVPVMFMLTQ